ncbi:MAG: sodium/solute symporter [Candidatus Marinimicrobia bacterium]|nr:sodium/solute symporter [Candidatus Neomarinimicrobiota bacterium]
MNASFNWLDVLVLIVYLAAILLMATKFVKEQKNLKDFFVASGHMPWWAVGMSILATLLSAISVTGIPAEFFEYGLQGFGIWWIATLVAAPIVILLFIKTFVGMQLTTAYEYLEVRFSLAVRLMAGLLFLLIRGLYIGVVLFASAIVLKPAFGGQLDVVTLIILAGVFSTAFAALGGIKAVIWTDVVQLVVVYVGIAWMVVTLVQRVDGGLASFWRIAVAEGKDFSFLSNPEYWKLKLFTRTAFFPLLLGMILNALYQKGADQLTVQRYLATRSPKDAARAMWTDILGAIPVTILLTMVGMGLFAFYQQNPDRINLALTKANGVLPHFVVAELPHGLSGLFMAAIVAAILTTVDSGINSLATVTMTDFQMRLGQGPLSDARGVFWARVWTVIWGVLTTLFAVFIYATATENISRVAFQVLGLFSGSVLSVFLLGILTKRANSTGVLIGTALGSATAIWMNYFLVNRAGEHVCYTWPIVFGVGITLLAGYLFSLIFPRGLAGATAKTLHAST